MNPDAIKYYLFVNGKKFTYDTIQQLEQALNSKVPADAAEFSGTYHILKGVELSTETIREQVPVEPQFKNILKIKE